MMKQNWKTYAFWIGLSEGVGALSGFLSRTGMEDFGKTVTQPPLSPPMILFPIVWGILYALMGIAAARVSLSSPSGERSRGLNLFVGQLAVNFFWSPIFFNARAYGFAFVWLVLLWVLVALTIKSFRRVDPVGAWLLVPYLLWLSFAGYLNLGIRYLN
jgi:tryptophan-rich sensory protein